MAVHEASLRQYLTVVAMEEKFKKIKPETLVGFNPNTKIKVNNAGEFMNTQRRWNDDEREANSDMWEKAD